MQTSRQVIDSLLRKRSADYTPHYDSPWGHTIREWVKQGMPTVDGKPVSAAEHFGYEMSHCGGFAWEARLGVSEVLEETEDWKIVRNGNGAALKQWKDRTGTPEHIDFLMKNRKIWESDYRPHLLEDVTPRLHDLNKRRERMKQAREGDRWIFYGTLFIWEVMRASLGDTGMFMALLDDPDWIHDFNRVYTDLFKRCYEMLFEKVGVPDGIWIYEDLGYRDTLFCRPELLRDLFFPYYTELVDFFHGHGLPVVLHSCGYQKPMIPLAVEAGFDGLNPMEVKAGNDIFEYADRYKDDICFVGGLDARILERGDNDAITSGVTELITGMRERGARFIYGSDHSLSTLISYESYLHSLEVYKSLRGA